MTVAPSLWTVASARARGGASGGAPAERAMMRVPGGGRMFGSPGTPPVPGARPRPQWSPVEPDAHETQTDAPIDRRGVFLRLATLALGASALGGTTAAASGPALSQAQQGASRPVLLRPQDGDRARIGGNRAQFKVTRQHTGGAFASLEGTLAPGYMGAPPHRHQGIDEIARVLDGELTILVEDQIFRVPAGGWHLRPRGQVHAFWNETRRPVRFIEMYLPGGHEAYMREVGALLATTPQPPPGALDALGKRHDVEFLWDRLPPLLARHKVRL